MRQVTRSAIVPRTAEAMFDLVADIESYPQFVPGCVRAVICSRDGDSVVGMLSLAQGPIKAEFTTRNELQRPGRISMVLESGPFSDLRGAWEFVPLGSSGCRVSLNMEFEFPNRAADLLLGPPFEAICNHLVDAFVKRAAAISA